MRDELQEIRSRWNTAIEYLEETRKPPESPQGVEWTIPAKDIRYLLNRLEAAERAAKGVSALNHQIADALMSMRRAEHCWCRAADMPAGGADQHTEPCSCLRRALLGIEE